MNLFGFGGGHDIKITKDKHKKSCASIQQSFDYKGAENVFVPLAEDDESKFFTIKRIRVFQMKDPN